MLRRTLPLTIILVVLAAAEAWCAPSTPVEFLYNGNVDPLVSNSAGPGLSFIQLGESLGQLAADPEANDGLAWHITDSLTGTRDLYALMPQSDIDHIDGATIVGRIKTVGDTHGSGNAAGGNLCILDSNILTGNTAMLHWGGVAGHIIEASRGRQVNVAGDDDYHIFRMTIKDRVASGPIPYSESFSYSNGQLIGNDDWVGDLLLAPAPADQIAVDNGAVKIIAGADTIPVGSPPAYYHRSAIQYLAATDPGAGIEVAFKVKGGTGLSTGWGFYIDDPNGVNLARWYGGTKNARPRIGAWSQVGPYQTLTGNWDTLRVVVKTSEKKSHFYYTPQGGSETPLATLDYTAGGMQDPEDVLGAIRIEHYSNSSATGVILIDDITVNGTPITTNLRTVKVYMNEDTTPVTAMQIDGATPQVFTHDGFGFGVSQRAAMQEVYFDWVSGTNRGAFAPGGEVAVLGHSLVPGTPTIAASILEAKQVPVITSTAIDSAVVACEITDAYDTMTGFNIESPDRENGIRVKSNAVVQAGDKVKVVGVTLDDRGERIIEAALVQDLLDDQPIPAPLAVNNKAAGGGPFYGQRAVYALVPGLRTDTFDYPDGALVGSGFWIGGNDPATASQIAVDGGRVKITGGNSDKQNTYAFNYAPVAVTADNSEVSVTGKPGTGTFGFFWVFYVNDGVGAELARWYGHYNSATPRIGGIVGTTQALASGGTDLKIRVNFTERKAYFYADGAKVWEYALEATAGNQIGSVAFNWMLNTETIGSTVFFDNMVTPWNQSKAGVGLSNVGLFTRICGRVTAVKNDGVTDDDNYFYVDDGSGLSDPTSAGIRCKPPSKYGVGMPNTGDYVVADGVMGARNNARYLWTWDCSVQ